MRSRVLASLSKSSRRSVPLPMSSQKCEAFEPLPPLPMTKTIGPPAVGVVDGVGEGLDLGRD